LNETLKLSEYYRFPLHRVWKKIYHSPDFSILFYFILVYFLFGNQLLFFYLEINLLKLFSFLSGPTSEHWHISGCLLLFGGETGAKVRPALCDCSLQLLQLMLLITNISNPHANKNRCWISAIFKNWVSKISFLPISSSQRLCSGLLFVYRLLTQNKSYRLP